MDEKDYTYQEIAAKWRVSVSTVKRWFARIPGIFRPTQRTVRIPASIIESFRSINLTSPQILNGKSRKKSTRKVQRPGPGK